MRHTPGDFAVRLVTSAATRKKFVGNRGQAA